VSGCEQHLIAMPEEPTPDEVKRTLRMVRRNAGLSAALYRMRLSDGELYRLCQARELILEAGFVEDPDKPGHFIPPSEPIVGGRMTDIMPIAPTRCEATQPTRLPPSLPSRLSLRLTKR
jgi:hypothetical protein